LFVSVPLLESAASEVALASSSTSTVLTDSMVPHRAQAPGGLDLSSALDKASSAVGARLLGSTPVTALRAISAATVIETAAATTSDLIRIDPDWWFVAASIDALLSP
jgi:hypothetical protein